MKLPRDVSGAELAKWLSKHWDYRIAHQTGSHIILDTDSPTHQRIAVPHQAFLRIGTPNAILRLVSAHKGVSKEDVIDLLNE